MSYSDKPDLDSESLAHYGVLGMKWGHRKAERARRAALPRSSEYSEPAFAQDRRKFGKNGADRINEQMLNGMDYKSARKIEQKRKTKRNWAIFGTYVAARTLMVYGPAIAQMGSESYVGKKKEEAGRKASADLFSDSRGIGNHKIVDLGYDPSSDSWS